MTTASTAVQMVVIEILSVCAIKEEWIIVQPEQGLGWDSLFVARDLIMAWMIQWPPQENMDAFIIERGMHSCCISSRLEPMGSFLVYIIGVYKPYAA